MDPALDQPTGSSCTGSAADYLQANTGMEARSALQGDFLLLSGRNLRLNGCDRLRIRARVHLKKLRPWLGPAFFTVSVMLGMPHKQAGPGGSVLCGPCGPCGACPGCLGGSSAHSKKPQGCSGCCLPHLKKLRPWFGPSFFTLSSRPGIPQLQFRVSEDSGGAPGAANVAKEPPKG